MNIDLTKPADPQEVIKELQTAYQQVYEENKRLRADIMFLENGNAELKAERDAYRQTIENILNIDKAPEFRLAVYRLSKITLDQYPSPSKDSNNG